MRKVIVVTLAVASLASCIDLSLLVYLFAAQENIGRDAYSGDAADTANGTQAESTVSLSPVDPG